MHAPARVSRIRRCYAATRSRTCTEQRRDRRPARVERERGLEHRHGVLEHALGDGALAEQPERARVLAAELDRPQRGRRPRAGRTRASGRSRRSGSSPRARSPTADSTTGTSRSNATNSPSRATPCSSSSALLGGRPGERRRCRAVEHGRDRRRRAARARRRLAPPCASAASACVGARAVAGEHAREHAQSLGGEERRACPRRARPPRPRPRRSAAASRAPRAGRRGRPGGRRRSRARGACSARRARRGRARRTRCRGTGTR